jgi:hypothetical protein
MVPVTNDAKHNIRVLAAVTFHFRASRIEYLFQVVRALAQYPIAALDIVIVTNVDQEDLLNQIRAACEPLLESFPGCRGTKRLLLESHTQLMDPWLLPWSHKHLIANEFINNDYSHFIYLEDDILLSFENFSYFMYYRDRLKDRGLLPAFQRVEYNNDTNRLYFCDQVGVSDFNSRPGVKLDGYEFVNLDYPWTAMFILDRELALEYIGARSFDRQLSESVRPDWDLACRAGMGLSFENAPAGFSHRGVCPVNQETLTTPCWSWVYHLPNNYTKNRLKPFGKTRIDQIFDPDSNAVKWREPSKLSWYSHRLKRRISALAGL